MTRDREEKAGELYVQGAKAVSAGGHELGMLAGHLRLMLKGTTKFPGALWQVRRVPPPPGLLVEMDSFADYLLEPMRRGLGLPSLHFLRQTLNALSDGPETLKLIREQFVAEQKDFDAMADRARDKARDISDKTNQRPSGRPPATLYNVQDNKAPTGNSVEAVIRRLRKDYPELHKRWLAGELSANAAAIEAGFRKKPPTPFETIMRLLPKLTKQQRAKLRMAIDAG